MRILILLFICFSWLTSCTTKKVVSLDRHKLKQLVKAQKDSLFEEKKQVVLEAFAWEKSHAFEMEIESDKDSLGNSKEVIFEKIRSPTAEKIIVRGGKLRLRTAEYSTQSSSQIDTTLHNTGIIRTEEIVQQTIDNQIFRKEKTTSKTSCFHYWIWLILILILLFLAWRLKLFKL